MDRQKKVEKKRRKREEKKRGRAAQRFDPMASLGRLKAEVQAAYARSGHPLPDIAGSVDASERLVTIEILNEKGRTDAAVQELAANAVEFATAMAAQWPPQELACKEGCAWCCYQHVGVSPVEVFIAAARVRSLSPEQREAIAQRADAVAARTVGQTWDQRAPIACPLLEDDRCAVYDVRPLMCRAENSTDADPCRRFVEEHDLSAQRLANFAQRAPYEGAVGGLISGLESAGLDGGPFDLAHALSIALRDENAASRWLAGERVFEAARRPQGQNPRSLPVLENRGGGHAP